MAYEADVQRAVALGREGEKEAAREILIPILKNDRDNIAAWKAMAQVARSRDEAVQCLERALRLDPQDEWAQKHLSRLQGRPAASSDSSWVTASGASSASTGASEWRSTASSDAAPPLPSEERASAGGSNTLLIAIGVVVLLCAVCGVTAFAVNQFFGVAADALTDIDLSAFDDNVVAEGRISVGGQDAAQIVNLGDAHDWVFVGQAGEDIEISVEGRGSFDPTILVFGPDGSRIAEDDDSGGGFDALSRIVLPADGEYTVRVTGFAGDTGSYDIRVYQR
ncbi:MAG: hypothetical protein GYB68_18080 [Chloroflexi bacterium]|nr:hypothetical protein [Chloroflexota bacterium]